MAKEDLKFSTLSSSIKKLKIKIHCTVKYCFIEIYKPKKKNGREKCADESRI